MRREEGSTSLERRAAVPERAKPVPKFIVPADALNQFKVVRSAQPIDHDRDSPTYNLIVVPQGAAVWLDDFYNATVRVQQGRGNLRYG